MAERLKLLGRHIDSKVILISFQKLKDSSINVVITGASGKIGYSLVFMIGQGRMFGLDQPVNLTLLELPMAKKAMEGDLMELKDSALPLLRSLKGTTSQEEAFEGCQVAILVGAKPRGPGMERKDLLIQNAQIFKTQGEIINKVADKNCKIVVVGNPANTNAWVCSKFAPDIPKSNFTCLTRLDQNRAVYQIASKLKTNVENIKNIAIWGNHSLTQYPDISFGIIDHYPEKYFTTGIKSAINDEDWVRNKFVKRVAKRGGEIIEVKKMSSSASAANAICDHVHDWLIGTHLGEFCSMGVISDGSYDIPEDLCFSFPVTCNKGNWEIVKGYKFDDYGKKKIELTVKELLEEKETIMNHFQKEN